jgi:DNA polymerase-4
MRSLRLFKGADLKKLAENDLVRHFGKVGHFYYQIVRGIDDRPVEPFRETQSVGAEDTFPEDLFEEDELNQELERISVLVSKRLQKHQLKGRTVTLKIKYNNFKLITRSRSVEKPVDDAETIATHAKQLLESTLPAPRGIRLLGISLSKFNEMQPIADKQDPQLKFNF